MNRNLWGIAVATASALHPSSHNVTPRAGSMGLTLTIENRPTLTYWVVTSNTPATRFVGNCTNPHPWFFETYGDRHGHNSTGSTGHVLVNMCDPRDGDLTPAAATIPDVTQCLGPTVNTVFRP